MRTVQLPEFYVDYVEILVAEVISIRVYLGIGFDIVETFQDIRIFKLSICHLIIILMVSHIEHSIYDAY